MSKVKKVKVKNIYIFIFLITTFFFPTNIFGLKIFNEPIFFLAMLNTIFILSYLKLDKLVYNFLLLGLFFSFLFSLSFLFNITSYDDLLFKDLIELFKPFLYCLFIYSGYLLSKRVSEEKIIKYSLVLSTLSIIFSSFVFFSELNFISDVFKGRTSKEEFNIHFYRFSGFMGYPGPFGYWLTFVYGLILSQILKNKTNIKINYYYLLLLISIVSIVLTGSKGAIFMFITLNVFFIVIVLVRNIYIPKLKQISFLIIFIFFSLLSAYIINFIHITDTDITKIHAIKYIFLYSDNLLESSFGHRYKELIITLKTIIDGFIFGKGPDNASISNIIGPVETAYFFYIYKFGVFGFLFYISLILLNIYILVKAKIFTFSWVFSLWSTIVLTVGPLSESITEEYKSFYIYFTLLGISYGFLQKNVYR